MAAAGTNTPGSGHINAHQAHYKHTHMENTNNNGSQTQTTGILREYNNYHGGSNI